MKKQFRKSIRRTLAVFLSVLMLMTSWVFVAPTALAAIDGVPTRNNVDSYYGDSTLYGAEKWDKTTEAATLSFSWDAYTSSIGYDPQPGTLTYTYPSHVYLNVGESLEAAGYMGHVTASYGENEGDATDFRINFSSATWGESTRTGFSPVADLISNYGHQGTCTEGTKLMDGSSSHYDFSNDAHGSDQIIRNKKSENENFEYDHEKLIVWRSNIKLTSPGLTNFDEYVLFTGTANKTGEVTFNPNENFTIAAAQRYTSFAWHTDNGTRMNRFLFNNSGRPECVPAEDALSMTFTVYDKSELNRLIEAADAGTLSADPANLAAAKAVLADREVTQDEIDAAAASIGDRMTMLINDNIGDYTASAATTGLATGTGTANAFEAAAFHQGAQTYGGYSNVVYSPIWSTSWSGIGGADQAVAIGRCDMKIAIPRNVVMVYDGDHEAYAPITLETRCNDTNGSSHIIHYVDYNSNSLYEVKNDFWQGYARQWDAWAKDNISATEQFAAYWHDGGSPGESPDSQRDSDSRFWWNMVKYYGEGNTTSYYDHAQNFLFNAKTSYKQSGRQYKYGDVTAKTDFYTINYQPIYSKLADAAAVKNIIEGDTAWQYTEASVKRAKATIAAMIASNPKNFFNNNQKFSENYDDDSAAVAVAVDDCAAAIKDAKFMLDNDGLTLEKKKGTVTFVDQNGATIAANGTTYSYENVDYGETISGTQIPVLGATYNRADTAQWDYSAYPDLSWDPAIEGNTILVNEPEQIFQINDSQTVQKYKVYFYDDEGNVIPQQVYDNETESYYTSDYKEWQYGDYPDWGSDVAPTKASTAQYDYTFDHWTKWDGTGSYALNDILQSFTVADVANSTRADLETDIMTKYKAVFTETTRSYDVTWSYMDASGAQSVTESYLYGATPAAPSGTESNYSVGITNYTFTGWSPSIDTVTRDVTYVAQYESNAGYKIKIAVPETLYMTPSASASTIPESYVNNTMDASGNVTIDGQSTAATAGKFYIHSPYIASIDSITVKEDGTNNAVSLGNFSATQSGSLWSDDSFTMTLSSGVNSSLRQTKVLEWTINCTMTDGKSATFYAYTVAYGQNRSVTASSLTGYNAASGNQMFASGTLWIEGAQITGDTSVNGGDPTNGNASVLYQSVADNSSNYKAKLDPLVNGITPISSKNGGWYGTATSPFDGATKSYLYCNCVRESHDNINDTTGYTNYTGGVAHWDCNNTPAQVTVDTSRYTNLNQLPNLKLGYIVNARDYSTAKRNSYVSDATSVASGTFNYTNEHNEQKAVSMLGHYFVRSDNGARAVWNQNVGQVLWSSAGGSSIPNIDNDTDNGNGSEGSGCGLKYNQVISAAVSGTGTENRYYRGVASGGKSAAQPYAVSSTMVKLQVNKVNKASWRAAIANAQDYGFQPGKTNGTQYDAWKAALKDAYVKVGTPYEGELDVSTLNDATNDALSHQTYTVKFFDLDNVQIGEDQTVVYGNSATAPTLPTKNADATNHYSVAWNTNDWTNVTGDLNVYAQATGTPHDFGETSYSWTGYTACTATHACDCGYSETATATITSNIDPEPTCSAQGTKTYTATFAEEWAGTTTTTETLAIDENAHDYGAWFVVTAPTMTADGQAKRVCSRSDAHFETKVLAQLTDSDITNPTETDPGSIVIDDDGDIDPIVIPALNDNDYTLTETVDGNCNVAGHKTYTWNDNATYGTNVTITVNTGIVETAHNYSEEYNIIDPPVKNETTGEWGQGALVFYCFNTTSIDPDTGNVIRDTTHDKRIPVDRADYSELEAGLEDIDDLINSGDDLDLTKELTLIDEETGEPYTITIGEYLEGLEEFVEYINTEFPDNLISYPEDPDIDQQPIVDEVVESIAAMIAEFNAAIDALGDDAFNHYTILFKNTDGTTLDEQSLKQGDAVVYGGDTPVCPDNDAQYTFSWTGWTPEITAVTADATYTATYSAQGTTNEYTVTWVVEGVTVETDENVPYGETPTYNGEAPTKEADDVYTYSWNSADGWTPAIASVTGDATYTAKFTATAKDANYANMEDALAKAATALADPAINQTATDAITAAVATAKNDGYNGYPTKITLDTENAQQTVDNAAAALLDAIKLWFDIDDEGNLTIKDEALKEFTVTWKNGEAVVGTATVKYGKAVASNAIPDVPTAPAYDATNHYTYAWENVDLTNVTADITVNRVTATAEAHTLAPVWQWSEDGSSALLTLACTCGYVETHTVSSSVKSHSDATCIAKETTVYTAVYEEYTAPDKTVEGEYGAHDFGAWFVVTAPTMTAEGLAKRVCSRNEDHFETKALAAITADDITNPTETEDGEIDLGDDVPPIVIPALNDDDYELTDEVPGNCTVAGYKTYTWKDNATYGTNVTITVDTGKVDDAHDYSGEPALTRPVKDAETGEWGSGTYTWICKNDSTHAPKTESVNRADYTAYDAAVEAVESFLAQDLKDDVRAAFEAAQASLAAIQQDYVVPEQDQLNAAVQGILNTLGENDDINVASDGTITVDPDGYNKYTITFTVGETVTTYSDVLKDAVVNVPEVPASIDGYDFVGWTLDGSTIALAPEAETYTVEGDRAFTAKYSDTASTFAITWVVDGESTTTSVAYGETPSHDLPTKADDTLYTYSYSWDPSPVAAYAPATYTAVENKALNSTVTGKINEANEIIDEHADEYDADYLDDLQDAIDTLTSSDATDEEKLDALNDLNDLLDDKEANKLFTITWVNAGEPATTRVKNGDTPSHDLPTKADDDLYTYSYEWNTAIVAATADATYTAVESKALNSTVTGKIDEANEIIDEHADEYDADYLDDLQDAIDTLTSSDATDEEKLEALNDLKELLDEKEDNKLVAVDTSVLEAKISEKQAILDAASPAVYTSNSITALENALAAARSALAENAGTFKASEAAQKQAAVNAAANALNNVNLVVKNGDYSAYNAAYSKVSTLANNAYITPAAKAALQSVLNQASALAYDNGRPYKADNQDKIDAATALLNNAVAEYTNPDGTLKDEFKTKYDLTTAQTKVQNAENSLGNYDDASQQAIIDAINAIEDYLREKGIAVNDGHNYVNEVVAADDSTFDTELKALLNNLQAAINNANKRPADYTEYDRVFAILEGLKDNDTIIETLHQQIERKVNNPLPRDITMDNQRRVDKETESIKALLDKILEKDGSGNYTGNINENALIRYTVIFRWLGKSETQKVVKGSAAVPPALPALIGVDGKTEGHYLFKEWDTDYSSVNGNLVINAVFDVEPHTDEDGNNQCDVCGCTIDTSFRCGMCGFYEQNKDIPVIGFFIKIVHFFVHLAQSIAHRT